MNTKKIINLRKRIQSTATELNITPDHDKTGHYYKFNGVRYPSVTGKLNIIKDQGLMNWKMNRALAYISTELAHANKISIAQILENAKQAPQQEFEGAGDIGKAVHDWREKWFRQWIAEGSNPMEQWTLENELRQEVIAATQAIYNCVIDNKIEPLACEFYLADEKLGIGGTLDDIWKVGKETWLVDIKTSNIGNKSSYYMQVALYWYMFRKLYKIKIDKVYILHVSKKINGEYSLIEIKNPRRCLAIAKNVIKLDDDLKELNEIKKPEIIKI